MNTRRTLGILAAAIAAFACAVPRTASASGDIWSITVYQDSETVDRHFPNMNAPLVAGDKIKFKVRLLNRGLDDVIVSRMNASPDSPDYIDPASRMWSLQHVSYNDPIADTNRMPQVGLWISGQCKYADIESVALADMYFTDLVCTYTVHAGDLAMPLKLVRPDGKADAMSGTGDVPYASSYHGKNFDLWNFFPANTEGDFRTNQSDRLEFYFCPGNPSLYPIKVAQSYVDDRDYDLSRAGVYVQGVDFDDTTTEDASIWRNVAAGSTSTAPSPPRLTIPGGNADAQYLYVWTKDPTKVEMETGENYLFGDGITRRVTQLLVSPGQTDARFAVRGLVEDAETDIYMAATPTNVYNAAGRLVTNFTWRTIHVSKSLPPGIAVTINPDEVTATDDYRTPVSAINVSLTQAWTNDEDLVVVLKPEMADAEARTAGVDPFDYIGVSTASSGKEEYTKRNLEVTIPKGFSSSAENGSVLYIYANRADAYTLRGIRFSVDMDATEAKTPGAREFFKGTISDDTIQIDFGNPGEGALSVIAPENNFEYEHIPGNVETAFTIKIKDAIGELNAPGNYTVYWDNTGSGSFVPVSNLTAVVRSDGGELTVMRRYVVATASGNPYKSKFYVVNSGGAQSATRTVLVNVDAPKMISYSCDKADGIYAEGDPAQISFSFSSPFEENNGLVGYLFIYPLNEATSNNVEITSQNALTHETSLTIQPGDTNALPSASIRLKDGYSGCTLSFGVEVRESNDNTIDNIISAWTGRPVFITVTNVLPRVTQITMNGTAPKIGADGTRTFEASVPSGVQRTFKVGITDPGLSYYDFTNDTAYTELTFRENGEVTATHHIYGSPSSTNILHTFEGSGVCTVTAKVRDKDMTDDEFDAAPEYVANVVVVDAPAISVSPALGDTTFREKSGTGTINGRINVDLNVAPSGLPAGSNITVVVEITPNGTFAGALPEINRSELTFTRSKTSDYFFFNSLDGTPGSESQGFHIRAYVKDEAPSTIDPTKTWREFYAEGMLDVFVVNEDPKIGPGDSVSTNEMPASINVPFDIIWQVSDVKADMTNMVVTWITDSTTDRKENQNVNGTFRRTVQFTGAGSHKVTLTVQDKDGGIDMRTWYYYVEPSMGLELRPCNPLASGISDFSKRYTGAVGHGAGRVWSTGAANPTKIQNFTQSWDFKPANDLEPSIFGFGYKVGDVDNGSLGPADGKDFAIDRAGTWYSTESSYPNHYEYVNALGKDSFFYTWLLYNREDRSSAHLSAPDPQFNNSLGEGRVVMPEYEDDAKSYVKTLVEAIFSVERFPEDNVGDINQDGIPDIYAAGTTWAGGSGASRFFAVIENGDLESAGDLVDLSAYNGDEDYMPARTAHGGLLISTEQNWATRGGIFDAYVELRGLHEGINLRADSDGLNRHVRGKWISDPIFSEAESNAIARVNSLWVVETDGDGNETRRLPNPEDATEMAAWKAGLEKADSWIPENRTDPTVDDTDKDGIPDGYEYYFWYSAMVGEDGLDKRLRGSKFTLDDIATGVEITPEEIAEAFDPTKKSGVRYNERDTDDDGLLDIEELALCTNPINWDTDGDGLSDLWEVMNGMNPVKSDNANNASMNADGDFMAYYETPADYMIVKIEGLGEYAIPNNGGNYVTTDDTGKHVFPEGVSNITAIAVFRYGKPDAVCVPKFRGGDGAKPLDATVIALGEHTNILSAAADKPLALIHDQVYTQLGFDPRTAWYIDRDGFLGSRWHPNSSAGASLLNGAGDPVNTRAFTAMDEYLLLKYRYEATPAMPGYDPDTGGTFTFSVADDKNLWHDKKQDRVLRRGTTNPNVPFSDPGWVTEAMEGRTFANEAHGADTDGDGVPDGWELYVLHNPNDPRAVSNADSDRDDLNLVSEYAGTDSCNAYSGCESIASNHPGRNSGWYNKFFPTDPHESDTDGDGLADGEEGGGWVGIWRYGNSMSVRPYDFTFIYGSNGGKPAEDADNGVVLCIRGGGLNPNTADTDGDLLPDKWERQFAGIVFNESAQPVNGTVSDEALTLIRRSDGVAIDATTEVTVPGYYITAGMDGTFAGDAFTMLPDGDISVRGAFFDTHATDPRTGTVRDFDFDHDGLQNFQEYLVQTMRHLRYDDSETPLMGSWMPDGPGSRKFVGFLPMNIMDGDTFYKTCRERGFAATGAWQFEKIGYFTRPPREWDWLSLNFYTFSKVNYDEQGYRIMLMPTAIDPNGQRVPAVGYITTDPRMWDTDGDGMDDYYEIFHGLNPLLGTVQDATLVGDVIAEMYNSRLTHWYNAWTEWPDEPWNGGEPVFDVMSYPWMMGTPEADADGDGLRNIAEALLVNMTSPQPPHTDPTPLWYTDSTALNDSSLTLQYYRLDPYVDAPDLVVYPGWSWMAGRGMTMEAATAGTFIYSFEENEGYDTDNDRIADADERTMTSTAIADPINFTDPDRRQALWFPGADSAAVSYSGYLHRPIGDQYDMLRQFTAEAWILPEDLSRDQVVLERASRYTSSTFSNFNYQVRVNFRIGIKADGRVFGQFDTSDAVPTGVGIGSPTVVGTIPDEGKWVHVALTFDGKELKLYQNGHVSARAATSLEPANGIMVINQEAVPGMQNFPVLHRGYTTVPTAFILGATAVDELALGIGATNTASWASFDRFYNGYIDEVRVWDGALDASAILKAYSAKTRMRFADVLAQREEVYAAWVQGCTRNDNDGKGMLPPELLQHYNFQTLPGAVNATDVMWEPSGFTKYVFDNVRDMDGVLPVGTFECGWWSALPVHSTVYENYRWVPWIQNTCAHLPFMDGTCPDSRYWSVFFGGVCSAREVYSSRGDNASEAELLAAREVKKIIFPNGAQPYTLYSYSSERAYSEFFFNYMSDLDSTRFSTNATMNSFDTRSGFVGTSDLLPLGGAFAKRCETMWDGDGAADPWEITADGDSIFGDLDANGIPDWWQDVAIALYGAAEGIDWDSIVTYDGERITAREAYLRDLAAGMLPNDGSDPDGRGIDDAYANRSDRDKDGIFDWWENLYDLADEDAYSDHDNDQLSNYVEYWLSEFLSEDGFPKVNPVLPRTFGQGVPDYFLRVDDVVTVNGVDHAVTNYLGAMFADGDMMGDAWEDRFAADVASRGKWDAYSDADDDGWTNWEEFQAGTRPDVEAVLGPDGVTLGEHPTPVVEASVIYNGKRPFNAPIVVQAWSRRSGLDPKMTKRPDAAWTIPGADGAANNERVLGWNRNRVVTMSLGPASVTPGSVAVYMRDVAAERWAVGDTIGQRRTIVDSGWKRAVVDQVVPGSLDAGDLKTLAGVVVGSINYKTGIATIDFSNAALQRIQLVADADDNAAAGDGDASQRFILLDYANSYVRVNWSSQKIDRGNGGTFYLSDAGVSAGATKYGRLRGGKNMFVAFADLDGDGAWAPGEPYGVAADVDVGWASASFTIELTDTSSKIARMNLVGLTEADGFDIANSLTDRGVLPGEAYRANRPLSDFYDSGSDAQNNGDGTVLDTPISMPTADTSAAMPAPDATVRVRVVRTAVNGETGFRDESYNGVVLDREIDLVGHPYLTEADLVGDGLLDLDWGTLADAWRNVHVGMTSSRANLTNATYRVVFGDGPIDVIDAGASAAFTFENAYEAGSLQTAAVPISPVHVGVAQGSAVTFRWKHNPLDASGRRVKDYPAFRLQVLSTNGVDVLFDSGSLRAPARDSQGIYSWTAPLYAGMVCGNGEKFEIGASYIWRVTMLDAKFTAPNWANQRFWLDATGNMPDGRRYGTATASVRYFGPLAESASDDISSLTNLVRVQAFSNPAFAGQATAEGYVTNVVDLASTNAVIDANAVTLALPAGDWYLCAYLDSNGNAKRDPWEVWGYANGIGGSDPEVYKPVPVTITEPSSEVPTITIFMEDCDTDQDGVSDAFMASVDPEWTYVAQDGYDASADELPPGWDRFDDYVAGGDNPAEWPTEDFDNDQLSNWAELQAAAAYAAHAALSPTNMFSEGQGVPDYFLRVAVGGYKYYLGEIYEDHDMVPDWWERQFPAAAAMTGKYGWDALADPDDDGWTNWEEYQAGTRPDDASSVPTPKVTIRLSNRGGKLPKVVSVRAWSRRSLVDRTAGEPDAVWTGVPVSNSGVVTLGAANGRDLYIQGGALRSGMNVFEVSAASAASASEDEEGAGASTVASGLSGMAEEVVVSWYGVDFDLELVADVARPMRSDILGEGVATRVRLVRTGINGADVEVTDDSVVLDRTLNLSARNALTELDLVDGLMPDIDWGTLVSAWRLSGVGGVLSNATYAVVTGNGSPAELAKGTVTVNEDGEETTTGPRSFTVAFEDGLVQTAAEPIAPRGAVAGAGVTFRWRHEALDADGRSVKDYPSFRLQMLSANGSTVLFDSGIRRAPARDSDGTYSWKSPLHAGMLLADGSDFVPGEYQWRVTMLDAKYTKPNWASQTFTLATTGDMADGKRHASVTARVRYYGPLAETIMANAASPANVIRVQAFATPDFAGVPAAEGRVANVADLISYDVSGAANTTALVLPAGKWYLVAYIDSNANGRRDPWESWGYANGVGEADPDVYRPVPVSVYEGSAEPVPVVTVFIEDCDTDADGLTDALQFATSDWTYVGVEDPDPRLRDTTNDLDPADYPTEDFDNDQLSNWSEAQAAAAYAAHAALSPTNMFSEGQGVPDYFLRVAVGDYKYYLGELYEDHDMMPDWWERLFPAEAAMTGRYGWDALADPDDDGWTNWEEYQAGTKPDDAGKFPVPTVTAKIIYNGRYDITDAPFVLRAWSRRGQDRTTGQPDAVWGITNSPSRTVTLRRPDKGALRGGVNMFEVFIDSDGDENWSPGEPYGLASYVDVGWNGASLEVELSDDGVSFMRASVPSLDGEAVRVRVVRSELNGVYGLYGENYVVLDRTLDPVGRKALTELDLFAVGLPDFGWGTLNRDWILSGIDTEGKAALSNATYNVLLGDGEVTGLLGSDNDVQSFTINYEPGLAQTAATPVYPRGAEIVGTPITFRWRHDCDLKAYPAFRLQVISTNGVEVLFDSGVRPAPARNSNGEYVWTAPFWAGMPTESGTVIAPGGSYVWRVTMLDAKFTTPNWSDTANSSFKLSTTGDMSDGSRRGTVNVAVRYYGPLADNDVSASPANPTNLVRVQAFASPDFAGLPAAEAYVTNVAALVRYETNAVNAAIIALPAGEWYVCAYIDSNANGRRDPWESWGYANCVGSEDPDVYRPVPVCIEEGVAGAKGATVFIEDCDTDNNRVPDAWEYFYVDGWEYVGPSDPDDELPEDDGGDDDVNPFFAYSDRDNDQLMDYAERLISEHFSAYGFQNVSPTNMYSLGQGVPDYFLRKGSLYLGQMFADADMVGDKWEDQWPVAYASRGVWDALSDPDDDGWSNWAEYQAGTRPDYVSIIGVDGATIDAYPIPTVEANFIYNGPRSISAGFVIQAWSQENGFDRNMTGLPDARWTVGGSEEEEDKTRMLGINSKRNMNLCLGPSMVIPGTVVFSFKDPSSRWRREFSDDENDDRTGETEFVRAWHAFAVDKKRSESDAIGDIVTVDDGVIIGSVNYLTGGLTIDCSLRICQNRAWFTSANDAQDSKLQVWEIVDMANSYAQIAWKTKGLEMSRSGRFYLSKADQSLGVSKIGRLREGRNMFVMFSDENGDGKWTPGEPYGVAADVEVGWASASFSIELTDTAPQLARMDLSGLTEAEDFATADALTDRGASVNGYYTPNQSINKTFKVLPDGEGTDDESGAAEGEGKPASTATTRIRVVRTAVNDDINRGYNGTVFDREIPLRAHPSLTEADLVSAGMLDLDWGTLSNAWRTVRGSAVMSGLSNATYRVVYGNGSDVDWKFDTFAAVTFVNAFELGRTQTVAAAVSPMGTVVDDSVTFCWTHEALDTAGRKVKDYPAFRLQVLAATGSTVVYDSGERRAPARDSQGIYRWTAPLYDGMVTPQGYVFSTKNNYRWRVSMLDAKFTTPNWNTPVEFRLETTGYGEDGRRYGTVAAHVRYFGPMVESVSTTASAAGLKNMVHVQAYRTADFRGRPVAEGWLSDKSELATTTTNGVKAVPLHLPAGTYYVCAYIDTNGNHERDPWESWGYVNGFGDDRADVYNAVAVSVVEGSPVIPDVTVFIEDCDTDQDGYPDAWEVANFGSIESRAPASGDTYYTKVNPDLVAMVNAFSDLNIEPNSSAGGYVMPRLMSALASGDVAAAAMLSGLDIADCTVENGSDTRVAIEEFSLADGITLVVRSEPKASSRLRLLSAQQFLQTPDAITFNLVLLSAQSLDGAWTETQVDTVTVPTDGTPCSVGGDSLKAAFDVRKAAGDAFFKVKLR